MRDKIIMGEELLRDRYKENIVSIVKNNYSINTIINMKQMTNGIGSNSFYIECEKGKFIFKDIEANHMNYPENEAMVLSCLKGYGLPVPEIIRSINGDDVLSIDNKKYHMQSFIEGKIYLHNTAPEWLVYDSAEMLGKIVKAMESIKPLPEGIGENFFQYLTPENAIKYHIETLKKAFDNKDEEVVKYQKEKIKLIKKWKDIKFDLSKMTCVNTHGDYSINQILCKENKINAVIDFTSACIHPIAWEVFRSYSLADQSCKDGSINRDNLKRYIECFLKNGHLNKYDFEIMPYIYLYQNLVSDYFGEYYLSEYTNKHILFENAYMNFKQCVWLDKNIEDI